MGSDSHVTGVLAFYEIWKGYQDGASVTVAMAGEDTTPYVTL
jgi:hypothetical protein